MKNILMALAIIALAYSGAEAQVCKAKTVSKHKARSHAVAVRAVLPALMTTVAARTCKVVPYEVCTISPDRRSVVCYKTTDLENFTPLNTETTYYGPTGDIPGKVDQGIETEVIGGARIGDRCMRNETDRTTVCTYTGSRLSRDDNGYYYYEQLPQEDLSNSNNDRYQSTAGVLK